VFYFSCLPNTKTGKMEKRLTLKSKDREMFALIAERESSTMTVKEFCELYDIAHGSYYYWKKKYNASREANSGGEQCGFTLLQVQSDLDAPVAVLFAEYKGIKFYQQPSAVFLKELIG
jgi:hypothetical protein